MCIQRLLVIAFLCTSDELHQSAIQIPFLQSQRNVDRLEGVQRKVFHLVRVLSDIMSRDFKKWKIQTNNDDVLGWVIAGKLSDNIPKLDLNTVEDGN
jgi:hypothetical protein